MRAISTDFGKQLKNQENKHQFRYEDNKMTHENLKGRVAVVTGGGGVLCGQFAKTLAKQG